MTEWPFAVVVVAAKGVLVVREELDAPKEDVSAYLAGVEPVEERLEALRFAADPV